MSARGAENHPPPDFEQTTRNVAELHEEKLSVGDKLAAPGCLRRQLGLHPQFPGDPRAVDGLQRPHAQAPAVRPVPLHPPQPGALVRGGCRGARHLDKPGPSGVTRPTEG